MNAETNAITIEDDRLWTVREVARYLGLSSSWVYKASERGELPCVRLGGAVRFCPESIRAWVAERQRGGTVVPLRRR